MQNDIIEIIQPTPQPKTKYCKLVTKLFELFLCCFIYIAFATVFYLYDLFVALSVFALTYIFMGIIRSKMRTLSIPISQLELTYTDKAIAKWYVMKYICYESEDKNKNLPSV